MRGTKRSAISDSTPVFNPNDSFMQSKRAIIGSQFDASNAETSIRQPPLDARRAESSRQHVRALNTQFASWVQTQFKEHPDELWEDGVQDYLNHAKSIMEKFSDVVKWLKENASKEGSLSKLPSDETQAKPAFGFDKSSQSVFGNKPGFPAATSSASFGASWKPGSLFNTNTNTNTNTTTPTGSLFNTTTTTTTTPAGSLFNTNTTTATPTVSLFNTNTTTTTPIATTTNNYSNPFAFGGSQVSLFGNANAVISNHDASNEADGEDDVEQPSSPSVKKSREEGIVVVHEVKCKLHVKATDPADKDVWKDRGMGQLSIKCKEGVSKGTKESKPTIIIRNDVGKILLNALIYPGIKTTNAQKNSVVAIFHTSADGDNNEKVVARTFLMRTKTEEDRDKLAAAIQEYAPPAAS